MAACDPQTYHNVDKQIFDGLQGKLANLGLHLSGASGTIKGPMGLVVDYNWDEASASLFIHVKDRNFLVPCSRVHSEIEKAIESCR